MKERSSSVVSIILLILSIVLIAGVKTLFKACDAKDDGTFMTCHWAEQAVFAVAAAMVIISLLAIIAGDGRAKAAYCLSLIPLAAVTAFLPGNIIPLCMMEGMRCNSVMQPAVMILSAAIAVVALIGFLIYRRRGSVQKKNLVRQAGSDAAPAQSATDTVPTRSDEAPTIESVEAELAESEPHLEI